MTASVFRISCLLLAVFFIAGCADSLILPPAPRPYVAQGTYSRMIVRDGWRLEAYVARSPGATGREPAAFVLRFTGGDASGSAAATSARWGKRPVDVWAVNYPGYGQSAGLRRLTSMTPSALVAFDEMRAVAGDRPIFVEGFSLGTVQALAVAARRPVAGVIVQNPPPLRELILGRHGWWNLWLLAGPVAWQIPSDLDSIANARSAHAPAIFLIAERDQTIPPEFQRKIADAYGGPKEVILQRGADHFVPLSQSDEQQLQQAIDRLVAGAMRGS